MPQPAERGGPGVARVPAEVGVSGGALRAWATRHATHPRGGLSMQQAMQQTALFPDVVDSGPPTRTVRVSLGGGARAGEVLGEQKDIRYLAAAARSVLNGPETTGMGYWSVNPYVGCAFGCAYCYARYAHRYVSERQSAANAGDAARGEAGGSGGGGDAPAEGMPSWLAFERRIFV